MEKIAFIGLGIMGQPMCRHLIEAGYSVTVYNRTGSKAQTLLEAGATAAPTPKAAAENADIIITIVSDTPDVEEVILGKNGVIHSAKAGSVVIDMSTISPNATCEMAKCLLEKDVEMLDAPVSGGDTGAQAGTLAIMVGGKKDVFDRCLPVFQAMGKTITHVGENGMGQTVKLCNQILVTVTNMATCEAVLFAKNAGVDPKVMIEATAHGAAGSWQLSNLGPKMVDRDYAPGFMIDLQLKDLRLAVEAAGEMGLPLPGLTLVNQLFLTNRQHGEGSEGTQALIKAIARLSDNGALEK